MSQPACTTQATSQSLKLIEARPYRRSKLWGISHYQLTFAADGKPGGVDLVMLTGRVMDLQAVRLEQLRRWSILPLMECDGHRDFVDQQAAWVRMVRAALVLELPK